MKSPRGWNRGFEHCEKPSQMPEPLHRLLHIIVYLMRRRVHPLKCIMNATGLCVSAI